MIIAVAPTLPVTLVAAALIGVGYGIFNAGGWPWPPTCCPVRTPTPRISASSTSRPTSGSCSVR